MIPVLFRYDDIVKDVIVVFPTLSANNSGSEMISYDSQLNKSGRNLDWLKETRPALRDEYISLKNKIQNFIGSNIHLSVKKTLNSKMHTQRINHAKGR